MTHGTASASACVDVCVVSLHFELRNGIGGLSGTTLGTRTPFLFQFPPNPSTTFYLFDGIGIIRPIHITGLRVGRLDADR